ncbi:hypothetical protein GOBAR_AA20920 [Gossypium barbadense]|uniref:TOG domain-containing protein n=1 Tax=Gossypium barbadense TaxID=3634 RepID=A0A2P5X8U8_GOSBA|nr:hypothetical protein GOBAR_AA20920 [Gossypium barbadense]
MGQTSDEIFVKEKHHAAPEWQKHYAALIALAQIAEGCSKVMVKNLEQVVSMVLNSFNHSHPRVRWAAINAIGQLSTDLGPDLQNQYHQRVLPALAAAMDDFQNPRVQEHFQKYYDGVMPYLKAILVNATDKSNCMLRAKSMECISLVGMAFGKEKFRDDAKQVMEVLMSLQGSQMETDDPTTSYMLQTLQVFGTRLPPLHECCHASPSPVCSTEARCDFTSADSDNDIEDSDDESMETIILGDKRIGIKTSVLEEKATECNMLCCYADELKEGFLPWIDQVIVRPDESDGASELEKFSGFKVISEVGEGVSDMAALTLVPLKFYFHEEVKKAAVSAVEKGMAQGRNETYVKRLSDYIILALVEALHKVIVVCS